MHKDEFLKQIINALTNNVDVAEVKVTYTNGEVMKIAFTEIEDGDDKEDEEDDEAEVE
ncbi:hypothetical protein ACHOLT_04785 [Desulfitobacterium sp. Sab5]|uniref:hypothetical protein n=1 Tax=Desulfitobacterium nosdiversum TaxID=3375356 RepID=UPI003CF55E8F